MRTRRALALLGLLLGMALPAEAGYRDLSRELEAYRPGAFYDANVAIRMSEPTEEKTGEGEFEAEVDQLRQAKAKWEQALEQGAPEASFFVPDSGLMKALQSAGDDSGAAGAALEDGYALEHLEALALLRNPGVRGAENEVRAALERYTQAWNLDEILRQYTAFTEGLMTGVGPMRGREPIRMQFPFPGVLALKGQIVADEVRVVREGLEMARRMALTMTRKTYWNLLFVRPAQDITEEMLGLLRHLEAVATTRYEAGKTSFQDVIKVRINRETLEEELTTLVEKQRSLEAKVRELLDLPESVAVGAPAPRNTDRSVPDLASLYPLALERRQELRRLRAMVGKMERMIEMAETRIYPDFNLNLSLYEDEAIVQVGTARMREPFPVATTASMGAGLPKMPWYGSGDAFLRETRQKLHALREQLRQQESATRFGVRDAWFRLDEAARQEKLFAGSIVDLSQAALEVSTRGYEAGRVMFADVIASYTSWLQANLTLERKRADLGIAHAELDEAVGVSPAEGEDAGTLGR